MDSLDNIDFTDPDVWERLEREYERPSDIPGLPASVYVEFAERVRHSFGQFTGPAMENFDIMLSASEAIEWARRSTKRMGQGTLFGDAEPEDRPWARRGRWGRCIGVRLSEDRSAYEVVPEAPEPIADTGAARRAMGLWNDVPLRFQGFSTADRPFFLAVDALDTLMLLYELAAERGSAEPYWDYPYAKTDGYGPEGFLGVLSLVISIRDGIRDDVTADMAREVMDAGSPGTWERVIGAIDRVDGDYRAARLWAQGAADRAQVAEALGDAEGTVPMFRALMGASLTWMAEPLRSAILEGRKTPVRTAIVGRMETMTHYDGALIGQNRLAEALLSIGRGELEVGFGWTAEDADGIKYPTSLRFTATPEAQRAFERIKEDAYRLAGGQMNLVNTVQKTITSARERTGGAGKLDIRATGFEDVGSATASSEDPGNRDVLSHSYAHERARINDMNAELGFLSNIRVVGDYWEMDDKRRNATPRHIEAPLLAAVYLAEGKGDDGKDEAGNPLHEHWLIADDLSVLSVLAFASPKEYPLLDTGDVPKRLDRLERSVVTYITQEVRNLEYEYRTKGKRTRLIDRAHLASLGEEKSQETLARQRRFLERIQRACMTGGLFDDMERTWEIHYPTTSIVHVRPVTKKGNRRKGGKEPKTLLDGVMLTMVKPKTGLKPPDEVKRTEGK